ncbi:MAG: hypothetical protein JNL08_18580 [Planctomycetes bacterium]|nr:hypothetical protein [Planctomycetota bacterium]
MESRVRRSLFAASLAALFTTTLTAQATLTVGPGGYPQIADAVAAAQPGDLIVVQAGTYLPFDLSIGLRIVAPDGATVTTPVGGGGMPIYYDIQPPVGQQATLVGLTFRNNPAYPPPEPPVSLRVDGNVVFADCLFYNWADYGFKSVYCNGGDVQFDRCEWNSVWDCMWVTGGRVVANACTFQGHRTGWAASDPTCILASGGELRLHFCELTGSSALTAGSYIGSPAIRLSGSARLAIADSTIFGGVSATWASTAIDNGSIHPVLHARSTILGGTGLLLLYPPISGPGPAFAGPAQTATLLGGVGIPSGPRVGTSYSGSVVGPDEGIVLMVLSFDRAPATTVPFAAQPVHFDPVAATIHAWGVPSGTLWPGTGIYVWQTVSLPPSLFGEQFWLHALFWDGATFQVGPTFGGLVH